MLQRLQNELLYPVDTFCPMGELKFYFLGNFDLIFNVLLGIWLLLLFCFFFFNQYWGKKPKADKGTLDLEPSKKLSLIFPLLLTCLSHVGAEKHLETLRKE